MAIADFFLKIDGIDGEAQDAKHKNEIDVLSWSLGVINSGSMASLGGGGSGKCKYDDASFVMYANKASPKLKLACANGEHFKKAVLTCRKAGKDPHEFLKYTFSDCIVSSFHQGGASSADVIPTDQITLNFGKIEVEYKEQKPDGTGGGVIKTGWDVKGNKST
jgi:type VI secretion system secreted protein Hcp